MSKSSIILAAPDSGSFYPTCKVLDQTIRVYSQREELWIENLAVLVSLIMLNLRHLCLSSTSQVSSSISIQSCAFSSTQNDRFRNQGKLHAVHSSQRRQRMQNLVQSLWRLTRHQQPSLDRVSQWTWCRNNYLLTLADLYSNYGIPVIFYD